MQIRQKLDSCELTLPIIKKAQQTLLSPQKFYYLCQQFKSLQGSQSLYFVLNLPGELKVKKTGLNCEQYLMFFDYLAQQIKKCKVKDLKVNYDLRKVLVKFQTGKIYTLQAQLNINQQQKLSQSRGVKLSVEMVGEGMIGRVAKVRINEGEDLAFKVFFDSSLVWQHGPWAEIPTAIYLYTHQVTKNIPEFKLAGQTWAIWEWIYPETKPDSRPGITYEEFATEEGLTALNYLNQNNYNPYQIRLDLGGIQKEYQGRRWHDFLTSIIFYWRKFRREGFFFLRNYLTWKNISYFSLRLLVLIISNTINPKFRKGLSRQWTFSKASK